MSKIMSTSGSHPPLVKGSATGGEASAESGAAAIFAALFGGMQTTEADPDEATTDTSSDAAASEGRLVVDAGLVRMMGAAITGRAKAGADAATDEQTEDSQSGADQLILAGLAGTQTKGADGEEGDRPADQQTDQDTDRAAEAGLISVAGSLSDAKANARGLSSRHPLAAIAEDMKQADGPAGQRTAQMSTEQDADFIGPPLPHHLNKVKNNSPQDGKAQKLAAATGRGDGLARTTGKTTDQTVSRSAGRMADLSSPAASSGAVGEAGDEALSLDAASLKAERMADLSARTPDMLARSSAAQTSAVTQQAELPAALSAGSNQSGFAQNGGQHPGTGSGQAFAGTLNADLAEQWLDVLDMQDEKWTDQLVRRIDREMRSGGNGLDLELNPRNLGRLKITLSVVQDQTNVMLRTETGAAAQMISDAESRLAQMLEQAGLKLGQFDAFAGGHNRGFGQQKDGQAQADARNQDTDTQTQSDSKTGDKTTSDGLVNLTA